MTARRLPAFRIRRSAMQKFRSHATQRWIIAVTLVLTLGRIATAAESPGQDDLDKAFEARLTAGSLSAMENVISLCHSAMKKGLDEENEKFAKQLLASSLFQRGEVLARAVLEAAQPNPEWPQARAESLNDLNEAL